MWNFPAYPPTQRRFTGGTIPIAEFKSRNGTLYRRQLNQRVSEMPWELIYRNVPDDWMAVILVHYKDAGAARFKLDPTSATKGVTISSSIGFSSQGWRVFPDQNLYSWIYDGEPACESVFPGRSNITVKLKAVLDL